MTQGRDAPEGYDWEDRLPSAAPEPTPLSDPDAIPGTVPADDAGAESLARSLGFAPPRGPDGGPFDAPSFTDDPAAGAPADREARARRRGTLTPWAIVAIVAVQAVALVACVALIAGAVRWAAAGDPDSPVAAPSAAPTSSGGRSPAAPSPTATPGQEPGTVTDSTGRVVEDGIGGYDRPASVQEHTLSWEVWTGGTLGVRALEVDPGATLPAAAGEDVVQDGYELVLVTYEVRYEGPGRLAPAEELWLSAESHLTYFPDVAEGLVPDPMAAVSPLADGETARFRSAFLVPAAEAGTLLLGVETYAGEVLYVAPR